MYSQHAGTAHLVLVQGILNTEKDIMYNTRQFTNLCTEYEEEHYFHIIITAKHLSVPAHKLMSNSEVSIITYG